MRQQKINYQKELEKTLEAIRREERVPTLLLHSCCGPCSSYVMEYLADFFRITVFYFNPNITDKEEYRKPIHFLRWQREWSTCRKEENGVFTVMPCGWNARQQRQRREEWIILQRRFPSVR